MRISSVAGKIPPRSGTVPGPRCAARGPSARRGPALAGWGSSLRHQGRLALLAAAPAAGGRRRPSSPAPQRGAAASQDWSNSARDAERSTPRHEPTQHPRADHQPQGRPRRLAARARRPCRSSHARHSRPCVPPQATTKLLAGEGSRRLPLRDRKRWLIGAAIPAVENDSYGRGSILACRDGFAVELRQRRTRGVLCEMP
jgi:hypothetical protein